MKITAFLQARLDEAEAEARRQAEDGHGTSFQELKLARVAAMRHAVAQHERDRFSRICLTCRPVDSVDGWASEVWPCPTIRHLAAMWADHPGYDARWSPTLAESEPTPPGRRTSTGAWLLDVSAARAGAQPYFGGSYDVPSPSSVRDTRD